jgi:hypothetical protein
MALPRVTLSFTERQRSQAFLKCQVSLRTYMRMLKSCVAALLSRRHIDGTPWTQAEPLSMNEHSARLTAHPRPAGTPWGISGVIFRDRQILT